MMFDKLEKKKEHFKKLEKDLASPDLLSNREKYQAVAKEYADLKDLVAEYDKYVALAEEKESLEKLIQDEPEKNEYVRMAEKELEEILLSIEAKKTELEEMLLDEDSVEFKRNVIMEVRAGTGGQEASLFAGDLYNMYQRYAANREWKLTVMNMSASEMGGIKEVVFSVEGHNVYKYLRFESGTHRV